jgi:hypothetical protein
MHTLVSARTFYSVGSTAQRILTSSYQSNSKLHLCTYTMHTLLSMQDYSVAVDEEMPVVPTSISSIVTQSPLLDTGATTGAISIAANSTTSNRQSRTRKHGASSSSNFKPKSLDALPFLHRSGHVLRHAQSSTSESEQDDLSTIDITTPLGEVCIYFC